MTTTVTIACARGDEDAFMIPSGFFFNSAALSQLVPGVQELVRIVLPLCLPRDTVDTALTGGWDLFM